MYRNRSKISGIAELIAVSGEGINYEAIGLANANAQLANVLK